MVRIPVAFLLMLAAAPACEDDPTQGELIACPCDNGGCTAAACPIQIQLDQTCASDIAVAEALIGEHVEAEAIQPLETFTACSRIEPGEQVEIIVRGGPWVWGPLRERCTTPGEVRSLVLQCIEASD